MIYKQRHVGQKTKTLKSVNRSKKQTISDRTANKINYIAKSSKYTVLNKIDYISKSSEHTVYNEKMQNGLFGGTNGYTCEDVKDLNNVTKRAMDYTKTDCRIYDTYICLTPDDALELNLTTHEDYKNFTFDCIRAIAEGNDIKLSNFEWYASFHDKPDKPHIHLMFWDKERQVDSWYTQKEKVNKLRKELLKQTFPDKIHKLNETLEQDRKHFLNEKKMFGNNLLNLLNTTDSNGYISLEDRPILKKYLELSDKLPETGRLVYAYLDNDLKNEFNSFCKYLVENTDISKSTKEFEESYFKKVNFFEPSNAENIDKFYNDNVYKPLSNELLRVMKEQRKLHELSLQQEMYKLGLNQKEKPLDQAITDALYFLNNVDNQNNKISQANKEELIKLAFGDLTKAGKKEAIKKARK